MTRYDNSPTEIESRAELDLALAHGSLAGLTVQGLWLVDDAPDLSGVDVTDTYFVGCSFASRDIEADLVRRGARVIPQDDTRPYPTHPNRLYTPHHLAAGFTTGGFTGMYDTVVYHHFLAHGGILPDIREAFFQRLHDHGIDDALDDANADWLAEHPAVSVIGIMGGHAVTRGEPEYRRAARLAWLLTRAGQLIVTGGGPGVMEAANLGSYFAKAEYAELDKAIDLLAATPTFRDPNPYTAAALAVRREWPMATPEWPMATPPTTTTATGTVPAARHQGRDISWCTAGGLAIPTWHYGHEPANLFAGRIAKYFSNALREDTILRLARGGIVFAPGRAGTVQEIFQAAARTFYATDGERGPFVFLGTQYWTKIQPVRPLLSALLAAAPHGDLSGLVHVTDDVDEAVALLTTRQQPPG